MQTVHFSYFSSTFVVYLHYLTGNNYFLFFKLILFTYLLLEHLLVYIIVYNESIINMTNINNYIGYNMGLEPVSAELLIYPN